MPNHVDFQFAKFEDGVLTIGMAPPVAVGGWDVRLTVTKRFGSTSGLIVLSAASGFYTGQSGVTLQNSGAGVFRCRVPSVATSGLDFGNYAFRFERLDSGSRTVLAEGYFSVNP